jgi:Sulfotransferase domain
VIHRLKIRGCFASICRGVCSVENSTAGEATEEMVGANPQNRRRKPQNKRKPQAGRLPDFLIIGAQKGGTTFLYNLLRRHPHFKAAVRKEIHFFDTPNFRRGVDWYRSHFPRQQQENGHKVFTGEASPYYLFHPHAARRVADTIPQAKLIALLRNPIDRAYSDYQHTFRQGYETLGFNEALDLEEERLRGEKQKILADESYRSTNYRRYSYLTRGIYVDQLKEWHRYFEPKQLLILKSEDFFACPSETLELVLKFLGLPEQDFKLEGRRNEGNYSEPMDSETRRWLKEYYEPHNRRLYEYLDVDFGW